MDPVIPPLALPGALQAQQLAIRHRTLSQINNINNDQHTMVKKSVGKLWYIIIMMFIDIV